MALAGSCYDRTWNEDKIYIKYFNTCKIFFQPLEVEEPNMT